MKEIYVNSNSWHCKLYKFWYKQKYGTEQMVPYSNLCPYMRAVLFWSWMRPLFLTKWYSLITWALLAFELPRWAGIISYNLKFLLWIICGCSAVVAIVTLIVGICCWLWDQYSVTDKLEPIVDKSVNFGQLIKNYSRAQHDRICPEITFQ